MSLPRLGRRTLGVERDDSMQLSNWDILVTMKPMVVVILAVLGALAVGVLWAGGLFGDRIDPEPAAGISGSGGSDRPDSFGSAGVEAVASKANLPEIAFKKLSPNSRVLMNIPFNKVGGIPVGNGTYLPLLNGVPSAPVISRDESAGPVPPVIAKIVDHEGTEFWEHSDGSTTTSRWVDTWNNGVKLRQVLTDHAARLPDKNAIQRGGSPGASSGNAGK